MRKAITLVEVIFSVGVVLIGLVGLLSILPLAGRKAEDSLALNAGAALAESVLDELVSRNFLTNGQLLTFDTTASPNPRRDSYVIDPTFCSGFEFQEGDITTTNPAAMMSSYTPDLFPFYKQNFHPFKDPSIGASNDWGSVQPRLFRVGISGNNTGTKRFMSYEQALALTESADDLNVLRPDDRTRPSRFTNLQAGGLEYGKRISKGRYSWFVTVNPFFDPSATPATDADHASVSVIVVRDRERTFSLPDTDAAVSDASENRTDERVAYVTKALGFVNGAGGLVTLEASRSVGLKLSSNDWIMLSSTKTAGTFHRWYRVISVSDDLNESSSDSWALEVQLDGPDWSFGFTGTSDGTADTSLADNTYATLVQGVVSVTERTVLLNDF